jgi:hypothetical protein
LGGQDLEALGQALGDRLDAGQGVIAEVVFPQIVPEVLGATAWR